MILVQYLLWISMVVVKTLADSDATLSMLSGSALLGNYSTIPKCYADCIRYTISLCAPKDTDLHSDCWCPHDKISNYTSRSISNALSKCATIGVQSSSGWISGFKSACSDKDFLYADHFFNQTCSNYIYGIVQPQADYLTDHSYYLPWNWTVKPVNHLILECPNVSTILGTFAVINAISTVISIIAGHRVVVNILTFGRFGKLGSSTWKYTWVIPLGLQLSANALNALIIKQTPGYEEDFKIWELMLFFAVRPRLTWLVLGALSFFRRDVRIRASIPEDEATKQEEDLARQQIQAIVPMADVGILFPRFETDYFWRNAALSQFVAELILQGIACITMVPTVLRGNRRGLLFTSYGFRGEAYRSENGYLEMIYKSALAYLCSLALALCLSLILWCVNLMSKAFWTIFSFVLFSLVGSWVVSYTFWAGFVQMAGNLYCPPKVTAQGAVWTTFSILGTFLGAGG